MTQIERGHEIVTLVRNVSLKRILYNMQTIKQLFKEWIRFTMNVVAYSFNNTNILY